MGAAEQITNVVDPHHLGRVLPFPNRTKYGYDSLNRLTTSVNPRVSNSYTYNALGDLVNKLDVGTLAYGDGSSGRPLHAVMSTSGKTSFSFTYDLNGNMTSGEGRSIAWTSFNKPATIANSNNTITFSYDPNYERYKESETTCTDYLGHASSTCTKYMINPAQGTGVHFEKEITGGITSYRHFISAGNGNTIEVYETRSDSTSSTRYFHKDHLGSIVLSTDEKGAVVERASYDAFGKRRNIIGTDDPSDLLRSISSHQGYTGHEHLDDGSMGLVNMNGRIYEPLLGRFMSADPNIQQANNLQNLNRYSYVINNPTSLIDPSGYWFMNNFVNWINDNWTTIRTVTYVVAVVVASVVTYGAADAALAGTFGAIGAGILAGAAAGAVSGALSSTLQGGGFSWQAVGMGALTGAVSGGVGSWAGGMGMSAPAIAERIGLGAVVGGVTNWAQAAAAGHGSWSAFAQGAALGAIVSAASIGVQYLTGGSASASTGQADGAQGTTLASNSDRFKLRLPPGAVEGCGISTDFMDNIVNGYLDFKQNVLNFDGDIQPGVGGFPGARSGTITCGWVYPNVS